MIYYEVRLTNNRLDKSTAEVVPYQNGTVAVFSENAKMKRHLEEVLSQPAAVIAPGVAGESSHTDGVLMVWPGSEEFADVIPELLSWSGYIAKLKTEVHKSIEFLDLMVVKAVGDDTIYHNAKGERILRRVPDGYIAVHVDGRAVAGGGWVNANLDKEDAEWTLIDNPYEFDTPEVREQYRQYMDWNTVESHPGVEEELYKERPEGEFHYTERIPETGLRFSEVLGKKGEYGVVREVEEPLNVPVPEGKIFYSPHTGHAVLSKFWPPEEIENYDTLAWYMFDEVDMTDEEKEQTSAITGLYPQTITGLDQGVVQSEPKLFVGDASRFNIPGAGDIQLNPTTKTTADLQTLINDPEYDKKVREAKASLQEITKYTNFRDLVTGERAIDPEIENLEVDYLDGEFATLRLPPYDFQRPGILAMTDRKQFEQYGGPAGHHGVTMAWGMGAGKTMLVAAADAVMRNRGDFKAGEQVTIVTAPAANVKVWAGEIYKFRGEDAIVVDGTREERIEMWEHLIDLAGRKQLPSMIVVGNSKIQQDQDELMTIDAQYMQLLAQGGILRGETEVKGGHVSALALDESGQFVNHDSNRHQALRNVVESIYQGGGIVWPMSAQVSGNSVSDTISHLSFTNKSVRDDYAKTVNMFAKADSYGQSRAAQGRKVWRTEGLQQAFAQMYGGQFYVLDNTTIAGSEYGKVTTDDVHSDIGANWGNVYTQAQDLALRALNADDPGVRGTTLGMMSIMLGASMGAVSPVRMLEYRFNEDELLGGAKKNFSPEEQVEMMEQIRDFQAKTTFENSALRDIWETPVYVPDTEFMGVNERDKAYREMVSEKYRTAIEDELYSWDSPAKEQVIETVEEALVESLAGDEYLKVGVAASSKHAVHAMARGLREKYGDRVLVQVVDGDMTPDQVKEVQDTHQAKHSRPVVTLVTGAGKFGLSLPSERTVRFPVWNSATAEQFEGRFVRNPRQKNTTTVVTPTGIFEYMRGLELRKQSLEHSTRGSLLDGPDSEVLDLVDVESFFDNHHRYLPDVRRVESDKDAL